MAALLALTAVPFLFPVLPRETLYLYADFYDGIPLLSFVCVVLLIGARRATSLRARRFWHLLTGAMACWLVSHLVNLAIGENYVPAYVDVLLDLLFVVFYLLIFIGLQLEPHRADSPRRLALIQGIGTVVFAFGLLVYFAALPAALDPDTYGTWVPSLILYSVLDLFLIARLCLALRSSKSPAWRHTYALLAVTAGLWFLTDTAEALSYAGIVFPAAPTEPVEVIWLLPFLPLVAAARVQVIGAPEREGTRKAGAIQLEPLPRLWAGPLMGFVVALPLLHYGLYFSGVLNADMKPAREAAMFVTLVLLAGLALLYQRILEVENERLASESRAMSERIRATERLEAVGQLTSGIAHDFNNLLTIVLANTELARMSLSPRSEAQANLEKVAKAAHRGAALVGKLLGFGRRDAPSDQDVDLTELVEELCADFRRVIPASVEIRCHTDPDLPPVCADSGAVEQVLANLLSNARDAMPEGGVVRVETSRVHMSDELCRSQGWGVPGDYGSLCVTDSGAGMDETTRSRMFDPFFTTKPVGQGTGLGMSVVYGVVKQHGGFIDVESELGKGTRAAILIPLVAGGESEVTLKPAKRVEKPPTGTETILMAEDELAVGWAGKRILEEGGYSVILAADGEEALQTFRALEAGIDLVISDLVMPKLSGSDLYRRVRDGQSRVPFIFVSGYTSEELLSSQGLDPSVPFVAKPWVRNQLLVRVREVLDQSLARRT